MRSIGFAALAAVLLTGSPALAQNDPVAECHRLAASPADEGRVGPGVPPNKLDAAAAMAACRAAVEQQPGDGRLQFQLGRALSAQGDAAGARQAYQAGADAGFALAMNNLGVLYRDGKGGEQDLEKAASWFRQAADAGVTIALTNLAVLYHDGRGVPKDEAQAVRLLRQAVERGDNLARRHLATAYHYGLGVEADAAEAERLFRAAIEGGDHVAKNDLAWMFALRGEKLEEAERLVKEALAEEPDDAAFLDTLGWIYHRQGRNEEAAVQLSRAIERAPDYVLPHDHLGDVYAALGRKEEAKAHWQKALDLPEPAPGEEPTWNREAVERKLQQAG